VTAYNPYLKPDDYVSDQSHSYISYLDANSLYGWAKSKYLPVDTLRFRWEEEINEVDFTQVRDDSNTGYDIECDLDYPSHLHRLHNDYRLAPEHATVTKDMSPFCKSMNMSHVFTENLFGTLQTKTKFIQDSLPIFKTVSRFGYEIVARALHRDLSTATLDEIAHRAQHEISPVRQKRL
jgi:hypothetical protein